MLQTGKKAEIEILSSLPRSLWSPEQETLEDIEVFDDFADAVQDTRLISHRLHPLAQYLTRKITSALTELCIPS